MSDRFARLGLKIGAVAMTLGIAAAALYAAPQNRAEGPPARQGRRFGPGSNMEPFGALGPLRMMVSRLGLSEAQQDQVKSLLQARQPDLQSLMTNEGAARRALEAAQLAGEPDTTIRQLHANVAAVEADVAVARTHLIAEVLGLLTPEQRASLKSMHDEMQQRRSQLGPRRQKQG